MGDNPAHLLVRADCSAAIGAGHFSRCMALSHAWMAQGGKVVFVSRCESEVLRERVEQAGMDLIPIGHSHPDPADLEHTLQVLTRLRLDGSGCQVRTVLDGYHFDTRYQHTIRQASGHLMVIDDMNHLPYYDADVLLNQNIHAESLAYNCGADTDLLLGLKYVLLRPEFLAHRRVRRDPPSVARKILVTLGGADKDNATAKVIEALKRVDIPSMEATVVVGPANPHEDMLREKLERSRYAWRMLYAPDNMAELMEWADLAISAGGSTCWEMSVMGLPFMTVVLADNQNPIAEGLAEERVALNLGRHESCSANRIAERVTELARNPTQRARMSRRARLLVDGHGGKRITSSLSRGS